MTLTTLGALAGIMAVGALIPGVSVLAVSARSAAHGFTHGLFASLGIVLGDIVFILIAIYGLTLLVDLLGDYFVLVKYLGGAYLIWLGGRLWRVSSPVAGPALQGDASLLSSFMLGLLITLADQKAILFYLGFFPAFLDLSAISLPDTGLIVAVALVAVGGPKLLYALLADRARVLFAGSGAARLINKVAGSVLMGVGVFLLGVAWSEGW